MLCILIKSTLPRRADPGDRLKGLHLPVLET
jgi:hypothetical protein